MDRWSNCKTIGIDFPSLIHPVNHIKGSARARETETETQYLLSPFFSFFFLSFYPSTTSSFSSSPKASNFLHDNPQHVIASAYFWILSARKYMQIKKREMLLGANLTQRLSCYFCFVLHKLLQLSLAVAILHSTFISVFFIFFFFTV